MKNIAFHSSLIILLLFGVLLAAGCVPQATPQASGQELTPKSIIQATPTSEPSPTTPPTPTVLPTIAPSPKPTSAPIRPAVQSGSFPTFVSLSMKDEQNGWGLAQNGVFRTADGGKSWQDVSPKGLSVDGMLNAAFFLDMTHGWVVAPGTDMNSGTLYRTADGGKTWEPFSVPYAGGYSFFLDAQTGWVLNASDCGAGSCGGSLYQTKDGGSTWQVTTTIDPNNPDAAKKIPFGGDKTGVTFLTPERGWVTGTIPMTDFSYLYITKDGGKTWEQQKLALPTGLNSVMMTIDPPRFFSAQEGLLPVTVFGESSLKTFYYTKDGGLTWTPSTPVGPVSTYDFVSLQEGFVWNGGPLHVTHDGGQTWSSVKPDLDLSQTLMQVDFVSPTTGWAIAMDVNGKGMLYQTTDGGKTWKQLNS